MELPDATGLDWLADLDWRAHGPSREDHPSRHLFLAEAAELIGQGVCGVWPGPPHFLQMAGLPPAGPIVYPADAFDDDGAPIPAVHARADHAMREHADRLRVPIGSETVITREEWDGVFLAGHAHWDDGQGARRAAAGIAQVFVRMAVQKDVDVLYRPVGGGSPVPVDEPDLWEIDGDLAIRRLAACGLALEDPFNPQAEIDHRIFISHDRLSQAIIRAAKRTYVAVTMPDVRLPRDADYLSVQVSEVTKFLIELMVPENYDWNNDRFQRAVQDEFGSRGLGRVFEAAKAAASARPGLRYFATPGRRKPAVVGSHGGDNVLAFEADAKRATGTD